MKDCPFCNFQLLREGDSVFKKGESCTLIEANSQAKTGTMFIIPNKHISSPFDFTDNEMIDLGRLLKAAKQQMTKTLNCDGFSLYWNVGEASGQGLEHAHLHIVPRYNHEPFAGKGPGHWIKSQENSLS